MFLSKDLEEFIAGMILFFSPTPAYYEVEKK